MRAPAAASDRLAAAVGGVAAAVVAASAPADSPTSLTSLTENGLVLGQPERGLILIPQLQLEAGGTDPDGVPGRVRDGQVRRGRLIAVASRDTLGATLAYSFASEFYPIIALYADWQPGNGATFRVGQQNAPFSLNDMTSSRYLTFPERSAAWALVPGDAFGFAAGYAGDWGTVAGGVYGGNINTGIRDEGILLVAHGSLAPIDDERRTLHLGAGASWRDVDGVETPPAFSGPSGSALFAEGLTPTGPLEDASGIASANLEAAWVAGPFSVQGELTGARVARREAGDALMWGGYAFATWTLTGERRPYAIEAADFVGILPDDPVTVGGIGAWEVGLRLDHLDLRDGYGGGRQTGVAGVLNWYATDNLRLTLGGTRTLVDGGAHDGAAVDAAVLRLQLTY